MNVNKILERNRFTALCGGCGDIFHYSTIEEVIFAHQGGFNCETPCSSCANGVFCACEYCQSIITDKLNDLSRQSAEIDQMFIKLENAAAPVQVVPTPSGSSRPSVPHSLSDVELKTYLKSATADGIYRRQVKTKSGRAVAYYLVVINGFYVARINPVRIYEYELTSSQSSARKFRTPLQLKYLGKLTDFLDSINRSYQIQVWRDCSTPLSTEEQSK